MPAPHYEPGFFAVRHECDLCTGVDCGDCSGTGSYVERAYGDDAFALADAHGLVLDGEVSP
jgi:hypothetical protein